MALSKSFPALPGLFAVVCLLPLSGCPSSAPPAELVDTGVGEEDSALPDAQADSSDPELDIALDAGKELQCQSDCQNRICGDDGCGGSCGECNDGLACNKVGQCVVAQSICGDGVCDGPETPDNCVADCGRVKPPCGNGVCDPDEDDLTCPEDCPGTQPYCGDGLCDETETPMDCPEDCTNTGPVCGNKVCEQGEPYNCPQDCEGNEPVCGNNICEAGEHYGCPEDCPATEPVCGNHICEQGEPMSCPEDCGGTEPVCGNGACEMGENLMNCPEDCEGTGPTPCETDADCLEADACPPDAGLGCKCSFVMGGTTGCVPKCQTDSDCPVVQGMVMHCTWQGLCKPGGM